MPQLLVLKKLWHFYITLLINAINLFTDFRFLNLKFGNNSLGWFYITYLFKFDSRIKCQDENPLLALRPVYDNFHPAVFAVVVIFVGDA